MGRTKQRDFAKQIVRRLRMEGYEALWAGGCVRDMLLGVQPKDYDVATNAKPAEVKKLFRRTLMVGAKFGVAVVIGEGVQVEVATFRSDGKYKDGRRPEKVSYGDAKQDALRRDFTINGMFLDPFEQKIIDYVGGEVDIRRRIIRAIGDPSRRFAEDHLRMLRAVRFAAALGFRLEDSTARAITSLAEKIKQISAERIADELLRILGSSGRAEGIRLAGELGLLKVIVPEIDYLPASQRLRQLGKANSLAALACLLYGLDQTYQAEQSGKQAKAICRRLKLSNQISEQTVWLVQMARHLVAERAAGREASLAELKRMMTSGVFREMLWLYGTVVPGKVCQQLRKRSKAIDPKAVSPKPLIDGNELMAMKVKSGPRMGKCLEAVYEAQLSEELKTKAQARKFVCQWLERH